MPGIEGDLPVQGTLFYVGENLTELRRQAERKLMEATRAKNTIDSYESGWRLFTAWCAREGREYLPASADTLFLYVEYKLDRQNMRVTSMEQHIAAVAHKHRVGGFPVPDRKKVRALLNATKRIRKEEPRQKPAFLPEHFRKVSKALEQQGTNRAVMMRAAIAAGLILGIRRSNLVALNTTDMEFRPRKGYVVVLRSSKTDQTGKGHSLPLRFGRNPQTSPAGLMREWLRLRGADPGPLFVAIDSYDRLMTDENGRYRRMDAETFANNFKAATQAAGLGSIGFSPHSLRAGCVTASHINGADNLTIMKRTGHRSIQMVERYLRKVDPFLGPDPMAGVL